MKFASDAATAVGRWASGASAVVGLVSAGQGTQVAIAGGGLVRWRVEVKPADNRDEALETRRQWLREMGLDEDEVRELSRASVPPLDLRGEQEELAAVRRLRGATRSYATLRGLINRRRAR